MTYKLLVEYSTYICESRSVISYVQEIVQSLILYVSIISIIIIAQS